MNQITTEKTLEQVTENFIRDFFSHCQDLEKQEVIREVLDKAYESVMNLDTNSYFDMIRNMLRKHVLSQKGNIYFSAADMRRMPEGFQEEICRIAEEKGGELTIITEEREIGGGFILAYGKVEENCTIKALFHAKRDELSDKVNEVLFI